MKTGVPAKGKVLTQISQFWFDQLRDIAKRLVRMRNRLHAFACFSKSLKRLRAPASSRETTIQSRTSTPVPVSCV